MKTRRGPYIGSKLCSEIQQKGLTARVATLSGSHPDSAQIQTRRADPDPDGYLHALLLLLEVVAVVAAVLIGITGLLTATGTADLLIFGAILLAGLIPVGILLGRSAGAVSTPVGSSPPPGTPTPNPASSRPQRRMSKVGIGLLVIGGFVILAPIAYLLLSKP